MLAEQVRVVRQPLRERGDAGHGRPADRQLRRVHPAPDDLRELVAAHARHMDLHERALDRAVLADQLVDVVGDADQHDRRADELVGEDLDRVGEERARGVVGEPVELVDEDGDLAVPRHRRERLADGVRRHRSRRQQSAGGLGRLRLGRREADSARRAPQHDLVERLPPHAAEVVARVAGRARDEQARVADHLRRHVGERRLADPALAIDDRVLAGLADGGEELGDLLDASGEEVAPVGRRGGAEGLAEQADPLERLRSFELATRGAHGAHTTPHPETRTAPAPHEAGAGAAEWAGLAGSLAVGVRD